MEGRVKRVRATRSAGPSDVIIGPVSQRPTRGAVGGAGDQAGADQRAGLAAYLCAHLLCERPVHSLGLPAGLSVPRRVALESDDAVDDVTVDTVGDGRVWIQSKLALGAPTLDDCVDQWAKLAGEVALSPEQHSVVIATARTRGIAAELEPTLRRNRDGGAGAPTRRQSEVLGRVRRRVGDRLSLEQLDALMQCGRVWRADFTENTAPWEELGAVLLDSYVVRRGDGAAAWAALRVIAGRIASERGSADESALLEALRRVRVRLLCDVAGSDSRPVSLLPEQYEQAITAAHASRSLWLDANNLLAPLVAAMTREGIVLVQGPGGSGKTRVVLEAARQLRAGEVRILSERSNLRAPRLEAEIAGSQPLTVVVDNAHRVDDLRLLVGMLAIRTGRTTLVLVVRDGFTAQFEEVVTGTRLGSIPQAQTYRIGRLSNPQVAELVRDASPPLEYRGSVGTIVGLADGNPQIALLLHRSLRAGARLGDLADDGSLATYVQSLIATVLQGRERGAREACADLVAVLGAIGPVELGRGDLIERIGALTGTTVRETERLFGDLADVGLLVESAGAMTIKPDLVAEHILRSGIDRGAGRLSYARIVTSMWGLAPAAICAALGAAQTGSVPDSEPGVRFIADRLVERVRTDPVASTRLASSAAPGAPSVMIAVAEALLNSESSPSREMTKALLSAAEGLDRSRHVSEGYRSLLGVGAAIGQVEDDMARQEVMRRLAHVYEWLPVEQGPDDGTVLAMVQATLVDVAEDFWRRNRRQPGAAFAAAGAGRQLLTLRFEHNYQPVENPRSIVLGQRVLPNSPHTRAAVASGTTLFLQSLGALRIRDAVEQAQRLWDLRRPAGQTGHGCEPATESVREIAANALRDIAKGLNELRNELHVIVRSAVVDVLGDIFETDDELAEFRAVFALSEARDEDELDVRAMLRRRAERSQAWAADLLDRGQLTVSLVRWSKWLVDLEREGVARPGLESTVRPLLDAAAGSDPAATHDALRTLADRGSPLLWLGDGALGAILAADGEDGDEWPSWWAEHRRAEARVCAARALAHVAEASSRPLLEALSGDVEAGVRAAVAYTLARLPVAAWRTETATAACLPDDVRTLSAVVDGLARQGTAGSLSRAAAANGRDVVLATARADRPDGRALLDVIEALDAQLVLEWTWARLAWAGELSQDLLGPANWSRVILPEELAELLQMAAKDSDRETVLDALQQDMGWQQEQAHLDVLGIIDTGQEVVTMRLASWLASGDERLVMRARRWLDHELDWAAFTRRAAALIEVDEVDIDLDLLEAPAPSSWMGSLVPHYEAIRDDFAQWEKSGQPALVRLGARGVARYEDLLTRTESDD